MRIINLARNLIPSNQAYFIIRTILGFVFLYSGAIKLFNPAAFALIISEYNLVPESLLIYTAIGLPLVEFLAGIGLIFDMRGSLSTVFCLLLIFVAVLWYGILHNLHIDCGCFSPEEIKSQNSLRQAFHRDILMIMSSLFLYWSRWRRSDKSYSHNLWLTIKSKARGTGNV